MLIEDGLTFEHLTGTRREKNNFPIKTKFLMTFD